MIPPAQESSHAGSSAPARRAGFRTAELSIVRWIHIAEYAFAALAGITGVVLWDPDTRDHGPLLILSAFSLAMALLLWVLPAHPRILRGAWLVGIFAVGACCAIALPLSGTPFLYVWPILTAAYFMTRPYLIAGMVLVVVTFGAALLISLESTPASMFTTTVVSVGVIGGIVHKMREHQDQLVSQLRRSAATDGLTGLLNRGAFTAAFDREIARARRAEVPLTLVLFDLDHFKTINDTHGHAGGDEALRRFGDTLRAEHRGSDLVARIGGEEFAAVLYGTDSDEGLRYTQRIAARLSAAAGGVATQDLSFSAGVASLDQRMAADAEGLLKRADDALYAAKERGRRRTVVARDLEAAA